jgi:UDP-3-O-[3-hydroxymyristoyl] glucosamine N-acyltransferase
MPDPRFFQRAGPFRVREIAAWTGATAPGQQDLDRAISDVGDLKSATSDDLAYFAGAEYAAAANASQCGACLTTESLSAKAPAGAVVLIVDDPQAAFSIAADAFYPAAQIPISVAALDGSGAYIDPSAKIGDGVVIEAGAVVGPGTEIGNRSRIGAGSVVGPGVVVGEDCHLGPNVTLMVCIVGSGVILHPGVAVGQDGFGFVFDSVAGRHRKVPQLGRVLIYDDVEIGANTTIDRGTLNDTVIGEGCRIDNQVQIGHNVVLGKRCIVVSQVGISGSCTIGDDVILAGQVGLADNVTIGPSAQVAAKSGVMRDVPPGEAVMGYPAKPIRKFWREIAAVQRLTDGKKRSK